MKAVFIDVDTQFDFMLPSGALYVPGAEAVIPAIAELNRFAGANGIPLISTADAHLENDPEFARWPPHCVAGTIGQTKPQSTLLGQRTVVPAKRTDVRIDGPQIILEKRHNDAFTNPNLNALLEALGADRYVVYGVVTEICVRCAAFGLLKRGGRVELATDAVKSLDDAEARRMLDEFTAAGGVVTTAAEAMRRSSRF
jgi:nicotinamidase/pyrazinamidase